MKSVFGTDRGFGKEAPSESSDANLRIFLLTIFGPCGRPKTPFQTCLQCSLRLNVLYCPFRVLTPCKSTYEKHPANTDWSTIYSPSHFCAGTGFRLPRMLSVRVLGHWLPE
jgi:hypothetical protein